MNPRKRRTIVRAVLAGMPRHKLNSENIRKFLEKEKEKGSLKLTSEDIASILSPTITTETKETTQEETIEDTVDTEVTSTEKITEEVEVATNTNDLTLENTKAEIIAVAESMGLEFKKSFSKSKLLELISNN